MSAPPHNTAIAVHACGFESKDEICHTSAFRLQAAAIEAADKKIENFIISGGVPYEKGSKLLAHLMGQWLSLDKNEKNGLRRIHYATACFDSSSDIQNILKIAQEQNFSNLIAISSSWHLWALKPLYGYWKRKLNYSGEIRFKPIHYSNNASLKTIFVYSIYSSLVRLSLWTGTFKIFDTIIGAKLSKRKNGYPATGCS